jgi:hypothetical protein
MEKLEVEQDLSAEVVQADASRKKAISDLNLFRGVPDGMTGIKLFDHQIAFRQRVYARKPHEHRVWNRRISSQLTMLTKSRETLCKLLGTVST